ncbi:MAG: Gfo/Idh/MocA family oxidoreductase [Oscillospiraceae bacterium]|jgi:hypothetical protein|nr:Gfo/Idh/MocA family oxidoreductase [Oscillospiraceae bacterium]
MHIAIIGVGGIGSRHLQAVAQIKRQVSIHLVDTSKESLEKAMKLYNGVSHTHINIIESYNCISNLPKELDIVIIATSSGPRKTVIKELLENSKVKYMILEKFLFPEIKDYSEVSELLEQHSCKAWVNCTRRMFDFYRELHEDMKDEIIESFEVNGVNWGLGCNGVHFLDILAFISRNSDGFIFNASKLEKGYINSKRDGYIEFLGTMKGVSKKCKNILLSCHDGDKLSCTIVIKSLNYKYEIDENNHKAKKTFLSKDYVTEAVEFSFLYAVQSTGILIEQLMETGDCMLPGYEESIKLHIPYLEAFLRHLNENSKTEVTICKIT